MLRTILLILFFLSFASQIPAASAAAQSRHLPAAVGASPIHKISLVWQPVAGAVQYELNITDKATGKTVLHIPQIYAAGCELAAGSLTVPPEDLYWQVRALDYSGNPINAYSQPEALDASHIDTASPITTTQFNKMSYAPVYPVYSWIPYLNAAKYDIRVYFDDDGNPLTMDKLVHEYQPGDAYDFYDPAAYTKEGRYYWMIQARDNSGRPISRWSEPAYFSVTRKNIKAAALGDSITHGGGAIGTPPGYLIYDWQTYCSVPVLNIGYSGDTTGDMLNRFKTDVLSFSPRILIIMGGINDIRSGIKADEAISNLSEIRRLCLENNIIPVLVTVSPINPEKMKNTIGLIPADDWQQQLGLLNNWILSYSNSINAAPLLTDKNGLLRNDFTTDGLHPDMTGKKLIGETVSAALLKNYPSVFIQ